MKNQTSANAETPVASKAENPPKQNASTPRPWEVQSLNHADGELWLQIGHNGWGPIAGISGDEVREPYFKPVAGMKYLATSEDEQRANAELICRCVNNHDALLEALKSLLDSSDDLAARLVKENGILVTEAYAIATEKGYAVIVAAEKE